MLVLYVLLGIIGLCNLIVVFTTPLQTMKEDLWDNQVLIGKIAANLFYAPAWVIKGLFYGLVLLSYYIVCVFRFIIHYVYKGLLFLSRKMKKCEV